MSRKSQREIDRELLKQETNLVSAGGAHRDLRVHLVYPNHYWLGMSNLGYQAVYKIFREAGVTLERAFLPENFEEEGTVSAWKTFESGHPIGDCDLLAFSLSFETDYPHFLKILINQGLVDLNAGTLVAPSARRALVIAGGTAVTLNPEPVADYVDIAAIGEGEEMVPELLEELQRSRRDDLEFTQLLKRLATIEGLYIPRFYHPVFGAQHEVTEITTDADVPARPRRRFVKDISKYPAHTHILTPNTEFKSMFLTETGRGCEMGCRFCVAGYIYRPIRKRSEESIAETVKVGLEHSKAIGFVGAAVSSHRSIAKLSSYVAATGARASLSSLMSQRVSRELAASLSESEYKTVALAPEAGTNRLRRAAGKRVENDQVVDAAVTLAQAGIRGFKLYFIVGLPTEEDSDVEGIAALAREIRDGVVAETKKLGKVGWVTLSVNPFIPKASTPFQWEPMLDRDSLERKIKRVASLIKGVPNLEMKFESPRESYFQALLSRGDRRVGKLLLEVEKQGKDWKWLVKKGAETIVEGVPPIDFYVARRIPFDEILPWEVVDSLINKDLLKREALRAHHGEKYSYATDNSSHLG